MVINGEKSIILDGQAYWTVRQFSRLTDYSEASVRTLIYKGNSLRKLKAFYFSSNKPLIHEEELFAFPFVLTGRPLKEYDNKIKVKRFFVDNKGLLSSREEMVEKCQQ